MKTINLTTKNLSRAIQFYQEHLNASVCSRSSVKTVLKIPEQQLLLELSIAPSRSETYYTELKIQLTAQLLDKVSHQPNIFYRPFLAIRAANKHQLPLELQDPDGHRWLLVYR